MNNRKIKFRMWHLKKMHEVLCLWSDGHARPKLPDSHSEMAFDFCPIMQYIGLKDKDGKEIYEGDIVEINDEFFKIYFNERSSGFQLDRLGMHKASNEFISNVINELKVVGNIYEYPFITNDDSDFVCKLKI